jgi:hypothetical protein
MKLLSVSFLLILLSYVSLLSHASESAENLNRSSQKPGTEKHEDAADKENKSAQNQPQSSPSIFVASSAITNQSKADQIKSNPDKESWHSPSVLVQLGLLLAGVFYTVFACLQWTAIRRQIDVQKRTIMAMVQQHRPILLVWDCRIGDLNDSRPVIQFKNVGPSNAFLLASSFNVVTQTKLPETPKYKEASGPTRSNALVLPPNSPAPPIWLKLPPNAPNLETLEALRLNAVHLFVYGFFDYGDSFQMRHRVGFAYQYDGGLSGGGFSIVGGNGYNYDKTTEQND